MNRLDVIRDRLDAPDLWPGVRTGVEDDDIRALLAVAEAAKALEETSLVLHRLEPDLTDSDADWTGHHLPDCPGCALYIALGALTEDVDRPRSIRELVDRGK